MGRGYKLALVVLVIAGLVWAVPKLLGGGDDDKVTVEPPAAPPVAATSALFAFPLPEGASPDPELTTAEREAYMVPVDAAGFADLQAFYREQMDEKPFRDRAWCGTAVDDARVYAVRLWKNEGADGVFTLTLRHEPAVGTHIEAGEAEVPGQVCPPPPLDP